MSACCQVDTSAVAPLSGSPTVDAIYTAFFATVPLMALGHCPGMCGPLMLSFRFGRHGDAPARPWLAGAQFACYQGGRALTYATLGAIAGGIGESLEAVLVPITPWLILSVALAMLLAAARQLGWLRLPWRGRSADEHRRSPLRRASAWSLGLMQRRPMLGAGALGTVLGLLPCGLPYLVLGYAASSASALHGAALMGLLVLVTAPTVLLFAITPALAGRWRPRFARGLTPLLMLLGACWLSLIALAHLHVIAHQRLQIGDWILHLW